MSSGKIVVCPPVDEAADLFQRMLWFNPSDNQGVRFQIDGVRARKRWVESDQW